MTRSHSKNIRQASFALAALLLAGSALAEWIPLGRSNNFRAYLDPISIQRNGDLAQIWQLMDFTTARWMDEKTVIGSIKNLIEYDCFAFACSQLLDRDDIALSDLILLAARFDNCVHENTSLKDYSPASVRLLVSL